MDKPRVDVLVTGGAGFIGSNFVRYALETHPEWHVTTLDKLTYAGRLENLAGVLDDPPHRFVRGDVADPVVAAPLVKASEIVVHFAPYTHADRSISAPAVITTDAHGLCFRRRARSANCAGSSRSRPTRLRERAAGLEPQTDGCGPATAFGRKAGRPAGA